jgi:ankyrin repeat protein
MSDRSFRDRLAHIADLVDLEQLDGLVNRGEPSTGDEEPSLHRLILGLEEAGENNHQQVHGGGGGAAAENHHPDDFDALVFGIVPDHIALFGLQHTPLTRAINEGKYELAEKLIASTSDPESFNDGSMVHAMSTGKGAFKSRARNLKIVRLLLEKGASPNFRTPNVLELPSETPFEVVINFYLSLLKLFRNK